MFKPDFFKGKRVLLTGHTGFKGTWAALMLEAMGAEIYGYALEGSQNTPFYLQAAPHVEKSCMGMMQDRERVSRFVCEIQPEIVIHLASHSTLNQGDEITDYIFDTNVTGVVNLLEAVRKISTVKAVLIVTSDKCYQNLESNIGYKEDAALGAQDPYSTSKACQELVTACYRNSFFRGDKMNIPIATARASNVIGGGDYNLTRLFPYLLECFSNGTPADIRKPMAIRPWQNVLDVLGGYFTLVQAMYESGDADSVYASAFNFGPEPDGFVTVDAAAALLASQFGNATYKVSGKMENIVETTVLKLDSTKAKTTLGWHPIYAFPETLGMAVEFKKRQKNQESVRTVAADFIKGYMGRITR